MSGKEKAMMQERVVGHVVGNDISRGREVWKVKSESGEKLKVASVYGDITLAPGLSVSFLVGSFKESGQSVRKAVDVRLLSETREELRAIVRPSSYDSLSLVVIKEEDGPVHVWTTSFETEQEAREWARSIGELVCFAVFDIKDFEQEILDFENAQSGFNAINAMLNIGGVDRAIEQLLTVAYKLGQTQ